MTVTLNTFSITQCLVECIPQNKSDIFHRMMKIHIKITLCLKR